jgi:hypothetical protein
MIGIGPRQQLQRIHVKIAGGQLHHLAPARDVIGALAIDLHGGKLRRHLLDITHEPGQGRANVLLARPQVRGGDDRALGIIGRGGSPQRAVKS